MKTTNPCQCSTCQLTEAERVDHRYAEKKRRLVALHLEATAVLFERLVADDDEGELAGVFEEDTWRQLGRTADEADELLRELVIDHAFNKARSFIKIARWTLENELRKL